MKKEQGYSAAFAQLEELVGQIEDDNIQLDTLAEKVKKANELIAYCEKKLRTIEKDIEKVIAPANGGDAV